MTSDTTVSTAPGRLGDPELTIGTDPRADPRMVAVFTALGIDGHTDGAPLGPDAPREQLLGFRGVEGGFEGLFAALAQDAPPVDDVRHELITITGRARDPAARAPARRRRGAAAVHLPGARRWHGHAGHRGPALHALAPSARGGGQRRGRGRVPQRGRRARLAPVPGRPRRLRRGAALGARAPRRAGGIARRRHGRLGRGQPLPRAGAQGEAGGLGRRDRRGLRRDEGLAHHRLLLRTGVSSVGRINPGLCHVGELLFPAALPDVCAATVRDVAGFARSLA